MARLRHCAAILSLAFISCSDDGYNVVVRFSPLNAADLVDRIEVAFVDNCASSPSMTDPINAASLTFVVQRSGVAQGLGELLEGQYGLYGRATNACGLTAMGCSDVEILSNGGELLVELVVTDFGTCLDCEGDDDCTPPESCVDGECICVGDCLCIEDRDCPRNMACTDGDCVCEQYYLDCDGFEDNGCERLGTSCSLGTVSCVDSFDCYLDCHGDSACMIECYGDSCDYLAVYDLASCNHDHCASGCDGAPMSSSCLSCLRNHCDADLTACEDSEC